MGVYEKATRIAWWLQGLVALRELLSRLNCVPTGSMLVRCPIFIIAMPSSSRQSIFVSPLNLKWPMTAPAAGAKTDFPVEAFAVFGAQPVDPGGPGEFGSILKSNAAAFL